MTQRPGPRLIALPLLIVTLASLLAACGGQRVSSVFSSINSGLSEGSGVGSAPAAAPTAAAASAGDTAGMGGAAWMDAAATAAPAAAEASAPLPISDAGAAVSEAPADTSSTGAEPPARPVGQEASLRAGELDDNDRFADYLGYLQGYGVGGVRPADVSERVIIRVIDDSQRPVLDARVTVFDGERAIFRGRTYAGGQTIFHPRLVDAANAASFRVTAEYGQASAETSFQRGSAERVELGLRGVESDDALRLDLMFLLDTTGSMEDELTKIQTTIDSIAQRIDGFTPRPQIRYGLVAYKDNGDDYVTLPTPFTSDLDAFRAQLGQLSALGGGDTPEAVDEALYEGVIRAEWSEEPAVRLIFLVADAAPHVPGSGQFSYLDGAREAVARGVKIYPIAASNTDQPAEYVFRQLAQQTLGSFVFLTYQAGASSGAPGESTPLEAGEQPYSVERLDDLIVGIVERELAAAVGAR